jgi:hypothetical protein
MWAGIVDVDKVTSECSTVDRSARGTIASTSR